MTTFRQFTPLVIETGPHPELSVIFVHGLGTSGERYVPLMKQLEKQINRSVRFVLPTAPPRPVHLCNGQVVAAWFDLLTPDFNEQVDVEGIHDAVGAIERLIQGEMDTGRPSERIVVAGFSQGGALSLLTALHASERLGGVAALSGWLPTMAIRNDPQVAKVTTRLPVFIGHGEIDSITPLRMARAARERLQVAGALVGLHTYPVGHTIADKEIDDLGEWLNGLAAGLSS